MTIMQCNRKMKELALMVDQYGLRRDGRPSLNERGSTPDHAPTGAILLETEYRIISSIGHTGRAYSLCQRVGT